MSRAAVVNRSDPVRRFGTDGMLTGLGLLGTLLLVASSWWTAALPASFAARHDRLPVVSLLPLGGGLPTAAALVGLVLVLAAWLLLGRRVLAGPVDLRAPLWAWTLPWLAALPYGTRDPWAYAAQGEYAARGLDPYVATPVNAGGAFAADVGSRWIDQPSPYGPLWLEFGRVVRAVAGDHGVLTVLVYRLPVIAAVLVLAWLVRRLADRVGVDAGVATWLAVLNPVTLTLGVGGAHNDVVMAALMLAGVLAVTSSTTGWTTLVWAGVWCALGAAVKAPAVVALAFAVALWWSRREGGERRIARLVTACVIAGASFAVVFGLITVASSWGLGWTRQLGSDASVVNWTSIPTAVVLVYRVVTNESHKQVVNDALRTVRTIATGITVVALVATWFAGLRRQPMLWASVGMLALIFLGPAVQPWYLCWVLPFLALTPLPRWALGGVVAVSVAWPLLVHPNGRTAVMEPIALALVALGVLAAWAALRGSGAQTRRLTTTPSTPGPV